MAVGSRELVGRDEELALLLALLDARDGLPAVAVVTGEAGIGKTTLWLAAVEAAQARGYLVLSCRPAEVEAAFSFVGLADLIGASSPTCCRSCRRSSGGRSRRRCCSATRRSMLMIARSQPLSWARCGSSPPTVLSASRSTMSSGWMRRHSRRFAMRSAP